MSGASSRPLYVPTADGPSQRLRASRAVLYDEPLRATEGWSVEQADALMTSELRSRVRRDKDAVVLVWGEPGSGKSTFVMDRARKVDETFTHDTLADRCAMLAEEVPTLFETTPRYGAAWIDEAASSGLLSTEPAFSVRQRSLVELINIIRAKNVVLFVVIPSPDDLAKSFRVRRADYRVECQPLVEGQPALAYWGRKVPRRHFFMADSKWLGFSDEEHGVPLTWPDYRTSADPEARACWDAYWPLKETHMNRRVREMAVSLTKLRKDGEDDE
ncbi:MAG: hypothetical protein L3K23_10435 [Thermoplasmata archaeon]|nr:hypothetical protein [Thermoplasmata archaeon]